MRTTEEIQKKIDSRSAKVFTAAEFKKKIRSGEEIGCDDVDIVTCGTFGIMSGTMAVFTVPVCGPNEFRKADSISFNGVPGIPGPCPNESLGVVDCIVYGTSERDSEYGGGHLFRDIVEGNPIDVVVGSAGKTFRTTVTIDDFTTARMFLTRGAFKNYTCFVNGNDKVERTIFSGIPGFSGHLSMASVSGCGELNPIQNDPSLRTIVEGARILIDGAPGTVIGTGTRSTAAKPNLSAYAEMRDMDPNLMGGFVTSAGPECLTSVAVGIPVVDDTVLKEVSILDEDIDLPLADVSDRIPVVHSRYSSVWRNTSMTDITEMDDCSLCSECAADRCCPVGAKPSTRLPDNNKCVRCGLCVSTCVNSRFGGSLGSVVFGSKEIPIKFRQSDRVRADTACKFLKNKITEGSWKLRV